MAKARLVTTAVSGIIAGAGLFSVLAATPTLAGGAPPATTGAGGCTATAQIDAQWGSGAAGGQVLTVTVANTSPAATSTWTVSWALGAGQKVVSGWNAAVRTADDTVTAANAAYNGVLAAGARTTFGVQLSGTAPAPALTCDNGGSTTPTGTPPDVTVTESDNTRTVTLIVGQTLAVALPAPYVPPTGGGAALEQVSGSGGYPTGQPLAATYRAVVPGSLTLTSQTDDPCRHATPPCAIPVRLWRVHVSVVEVAPTGRTVVATQADNLGTVGLRAGDTLVVSLPGNYLPPAVSAAGVLVRRAISGGYPTGQPLVARYLAAAAGRVDITTRTDDPCNHAPTPCPSPTVPWTLHVTVTA